MNITGDAYRNLASVYINEVKAKNIPLPQRFKGETTKGYAWRDEETQKIWVSIYPRKELRQVPSLKGTFKYMVKNICYCEDGETREAAKLTSMISFGDERFCDKVGSLENEYNIRSNLNGVVGVPRQYFWSVYEGNKANLGGPCQKFVAIHEHKGTTIGQLIKDNTIPVGSKNNQDLLKFHYGIFKSGLFALAQVHNLNIFINDLTVSNTLIDSKGDVSFCDFGFSAYLNGLNPSEKSKVMRNGTHMIMSPERMMYFIHKNDFVLLNQLGLEGDVWSLGLIFCHLYFGVNHIAYDTFKELYDIEMSINPRQTELEWMINSAKIDNAKSKIIDLIMKLEELYENNPQRTGIEGWIDRLLHPYRQKRYTAQQAFDDLIVLGRQMGLES